LPLPVSLGGGGEVWIAGVRISGLNGFGGSDGWGCGDNPRFGGADAGLSLGVGCGDMELSPGLASGAAQYPQNIVPSGFSLPHCLHAGIRSPWPHAEFLRNQQTSSWQLSPAHLLPWSNHFSCATGRAPKPATLQT